MWETHLWGNTHDHRLFVWLWYDDALQTCEAPVGVPSWSTWFPLWCLELRPSRYVCVCVCLHLTLNSTFLCVSSLWRVTLCYTVRSSLGHKGLWQSVDICRAGTSSHNISQVHKVIRTYGSLFCHSSYGSAPWSNGRRSCLAITLKSTSSCVELSDSVIFEPELNQ